MEEWKTYKLKDICIKVTDGSHFSPEGIEDGYPMFSVKDMLEYGFDYSKCKRISEIDFNKMKSSGCVPQKGDVLVAKDGSFLKQIFVCEETMDEAILSSIAIFRPDTSKVCPEYLCYLIKSPKVYDYISKNCVSGSALPRIVLKAFKEVELDIPSLDMQKSIVTRLKCIDDKIRINNRINHNLEEQAQVLYKSYFVDFEPFKDGKFVDSELGMIPEGWRVAELGTVTRQNSQKVKDRIDVKVLSPVTTGELVLSEEYFTKQVFSESISKYIVVKPLHFAYNPARVNIGSIGMNMFSFDGCVSPVYVVFECEKGYHHFFDYYRKTESFKDEVLNRAIGGVRQTLSYKDFALIKLVYPPYDIVEKFNCIYAGLLENKNSIKREISKLSELRDTLLPKLLSGELKIDDFTC